MNISQHGHFPRKIAVVVLSCSFMLPLGRAQESGTKPIATELALNMSSKAPERPERLMQPNFALIEQVEATELGEQVQVRISGSRALSCAPFQLTDPIRLVLDCTGALVRAKSTPSQFDLDPVRAVRFGQFKTDVARVVVDLASQTPYTVHAEGNIVVVTFDSIHRNPASLESKSKPTDPTARPVKGPGEQIASAPLPTVPNQLPVAKVEDLISPSPARAEPLPTRQSLSAPAQLKPAPVRVKEDVGVAATVADTAPLAQKSNSSSVDQDYVIGVQDLLAIDVWREPEVSRTVPVRPDGKISLPLVGELRVSGLTPRQVESQLSAELEAYVHKPQVTVVVQEVNSRKFYVIGQVERPGTYPLSAHMTVLEALATVGGFRDFAKVHQIYLLRLLPDGSRRRIYFDYKAAVNGKDPYHDTELEIGDTLVVP